MPEELQLPSPFHEGEREAQSRVGVRDKAERLGQKMIRDFMPDQHREFYHQLPMLFVGSVDDGGRPWASVVVGEPGFVTSPDANTLTVQSPILSHDPMAEHLKEGDQVGLLGLEFSTRRRNRMNGEVRSLSSEGFEVKVSQAFGNCPLYIQQRDVQMRDNKTKPPLRGRAVNKDVRELIERADTFFISSVFEESGADMSHRGGKPGFVKVEDNTLVFPDFKGNNHFNTIGNLLANPKAGLLFLDFDSGDVLYITAKTEIVWDGPKVEAFEGAQRLVRCRVDEWVLAPESLPFTWELQEYSPGLKRTGTWDFG